MGNWSIEVRVASIASSGGHYYLALRDDSGTVVRSLHGYPQDPGKNGYLWVYNEPGLENQGRATDTGVSRQLAAGSEVQIQTMWSKAIAVGSEINGKGIEYPGLMANSLDIDGYYNSNSVARALISGIGGNASDFDNLTDLYTPHWKDDILKDFSIDPSAITTPLPDWRSYNDSPDPQDQLLYAVDDSSLDPLGEEASYHVSDEAIEQLAGLDLPDDLKATDGNGWSRAVADGLIEAAGIDLDDDLRAEIETVTVEAETAPPSYPTADTASYAAWTQSRAAEIGAYRNDPAALALISDPSALALYGSALAAGAIHGALVNPTTSNVLLAFNATREKRSQSRFIHSLHEKQEVRDVA